MESQVNEVKVGLILLVYISMSLKKADETTKCLSVSQQNPIIYGFRNGRFTNVLVGEGGDALSFTKNRRCGFWWRFEP